MFKQRKPGGMPAHRKKADQSPKRAREQKMWEERKDFVLKFLRGKDPLRSSELRAGIKSKVPPGTRQRVLSMLLAEKKIKREGWSKGTRWSLV